MWLSQTCRRPYQEELESGLKTVTGWQYVFDEVYADQEFPTGETR